MSEIYNFLDYMWEYLSTEYCEIFQANFIGILEILEVNSVLTIFLCDMGLIQ